MYRTALATAAEKRGWTVHWYNPKSLDTRSPQLPNQDQRLAMAAALAVVGT